MRIYLLEVKTQKELPANISKVNIRDILSIGSNWNFGWRELFATEGGVFFKISLQESPNKVEGIIMLSVYFKEMVYMNNLEVAPQNLGDQKRYDRVAGCLLAFGCRYAIQQGKGNYKGYLTFESKTKLIPLYEGKYGAKRTGGLKMYIDPEQGRQLILRYLN